MDQGENKSLTIKVADYIQEYLSDTLHHSRVLEENNVSFMYEDGVPIRKLFINNLAERTTYKDLIKLFSKYGNVESCFLRRNQGKSNYAFVTFNSAEAAIRATYEDRISLHNRNLRVMPADSWHQPDNINNQYYSTKDKSKFDKKVYNEQCNQEYIENDITENSIQILNDDCLIHIFLQLPIVDRIRIERVCKRWRALSLESWCRVKKLDLSFSMWGSLPESSKQKEINTGTLRKVLLRCGSYLNEINLSQRPCPLSPTSGIHSLADNCHDITKFSLGHTAYACDIDLQKLFKANPKLRYFKVAFGKICGRCLFHLPLETMEEIVLEFCDSLQEQFLPQAIAKLKNLKTLIIHGCNILSGNVVSSIGTYCTNLKILELSCISFWTHPNDLQQIGQLSNLELLKISTNLVVTDELLSNLASKCLQLKYIDISESLFVTNVGVAAIATLPKLETLIINNLPLETDMNLRDMCNLKTLECSNCKFTDKTMIGLIESAPQLELLDLSGCRGVTNETLKKAAAITVNRTNNTILKIFVGGTAVDVGTFDMVSPFLHIVNVDLSDRDMFKPLTL
ncbi:unnamed protein product [Xylocopa violacea]|uniref:RRM domain-containing protein n=1 Tax=Xylocopa violacea TaxID=135666 RepID=A0ABP1P4U0_XYLVO